MSLKTKTGKGGLRTIKGVPAKRKIARRRGRLGGKDGLKAFLALPKRRTAEAGAKLGAGAVATRPYVQTLVSDEDVRENLDDAYRALAEAYERISSRGDVAEAVLDDRRTRRQLKRAAHSMREAASTVRGAKPRSRGRRRAVTVIVVVAAGSAAAVSLNEDVRRRILGLVGVGSEGEAGPPHGSNGSQPTSTQPEGAPPAAATSQP